MAIENLISEIDAEIARLEQVRALLSGTTSRAAKKRGRPAGVAPVTKPAKRVMSAEARERIAAAQRKRWAKQKRATAKQVASAKRAKKGSAKKAAAKTAKPVESNTAEKKSE